MEQFGHIRKTEVIIHNQQGLWFGLKTKRKKPSLKCTAKRKKEGSVENIAKLFVTISDGQGDVLCEKYEDEFTGQFFAGFIKRHFNDAF